MLIRIMRLFFCYHFCLYKNICKGWGLNHKALPGFLAISKAEQIIHHIAKKRDF